MLCRVEKIERFPLARDNVNEEPDKIQQVVEWEKGQYDWAWVQHDTKNVARFRFDPDELWRDTMFRRTSTMIHRICHNIVFVTFGESHRERTPVFVQKA